MQHVGEHAGFDLRNIDRLLLLVDAGLHAVVANAVAGARTHRVVHRDNREGTNGVAALAQRVHLGDLLVERTAGERNAERVGRDRAGLVVNALRAAVLVALVAEHAVVDLAQVLERRVARVGELEALATAELFLGPEDLFGQRRDGPRDLHQVVVVEVLGETKHHPAPIPRIVDVRRAPAFERLDLRGDDRLVGVGAARTQGDFTIEEGATQMGDFRFEERRPSEPFNPRVVLRGGGDVGATLQRGPRRGSRAGVFEQRQRPTPDEIDLEAEQHVVGFGGGHQRLGFGPHAEQTADEPAHVWRHGYHQVGARHRAERLRRCAVLLPLRPQLRLGLLHRVGKAAMELTQPGRLMQVGKREVRQS